MSTGSKKALSSELVLGAKWDECLADATLKMAGGLAVGKDEQESQLELQLIDPGFRLDFRLRLLAVPLPPARLAAGLRNWGRLRHGLQ